VEVQLKNIIKVAALGAMIAVIAPTMGVHADDYYYHHHRHHHHRKVQDIRHDQRDIARDQQDIARDKAVENEQVREGNFGAAAATHQDIRNDEADVHSDYRDLNNDINH
jgi:hypothetical protein